MSLLERLMNQCDLYKKNERDKLYNPAVLTKLVQNFRSHKWILALPDRMFYEKELEVNVKYISWKCVLQFYYIVYYGCVSSSMWRLAWKVWQAWSSSTIQSATKLFFSEKCFWNIFQIFISIKCDSYKVWYDNF